MDRYPKSGGEESARRLAEECEQEECERLARQIRFTVPMAQLALWREEIYEPTAKERRAVGDRVFIDRHYPAKA
jgi:hypothetical protein